MSNTFADSLFVLKPCPACGRERPVPRPYKDKGWRVQCCCGAITEFFEDPRDADIAWNAWARRVAKHKEQSS